MATRVGDPGRLVTTFPAPGGRLGVFVYPTSPAIVLGSAQDPPQARDLAVVRRRSGGGAVLVAPGEQVWFDLFIPAVDPLADTDVARAALVAGRVWERAFASLGLDGLEVHEGAFIESRYSRLVCFSGLGPGEVRWQGRKLVGISQRRTRAGAWFFTMAHRAFSAREHATLLGASREEMLALEADLETSVVSLPVDLEACAQALRSALS